MPRGKNLTFDENKKKRPGDTPGVFAYTLRRCYCSVSSSLCVAGTFWHVGRAATVESA